MNASDERLLYQQKMFTAVRDYCLKVTGRCHAMTFPAFYKQYPVLAKAETAFGEHTYVQMNLSDTAIVNLEFVGDGIGFTAMFSGQPLYMRLAFDDILGLHNCRDHAIHRLSIAATSNYEYGLDPRTIVMMDMSLRQDMAAAFNPEAEPEPEVPTEPVPKRPVLAIVK